MSWYVLFFAILDGDSQNPDYERQEFGFNKIRMERYLQSCGRSSADITEKRRRICYNQTIYDDTRLEATEYFGLTLEVQDFVAQGGPTTVYTEVDVEHAAIRITDDNSKYNL